MKADLDRSKGSFKLDLLETANADPMVNPSDLKLLIAYVSVMTWPNCRAWLSATLARAKTGLSERQFWDSRARLLGKNDEKRAYLIPARQKGKISVYMLINPWRDEAIAHVDAMIGYHREVERQKKAAKRAALSLQNVQGHEAGCPCTLCRSVPAEFAGHYPSVSTPRKKESRQEGSAGGTVVPFKPNPRRAS